MPAIKELEHDEISPSDFQVTEINLDGINPLRIFTRCCVNVRIVLVGYSTNFIKYMLASKTRKTNPISNIFANP